MKNFNLEFLEAYKRLDELCKQILMSDRGISEYIDEMSNESQGYRMVSNWENDYKQLKKMRWIRNQLAHEVNSLEKQLATVEDIKWLENFYVRIIECTDPFSMLRKVKNTSQKLSVKSEHQQEIFQQNNEFVRELNRGKETTILVGIAFLIAIIILVGVFLAFLII